MPQIEAVVKEVKAKLGKEKLRSADLFSGSGAVARLLRTHSDYLVANDLESYARVLSECYLKDSTLWENGISISELADKFWEVKVAAATEKQRGLISRLYAPKDENNIKAGERAFYTPYNAAYLDGARQAIEKLDPNLRPFILAPLLYLASKHVNTCGIFKGFYKKDGVGHFGGAGENALERIKAKMALTPPMFWDEPCEVKVLQMDAYKAALRAECENLDLVYLDPPYNQHPYGANYFMLNLLVDYKEPTEISKVSGISQDWNRSAYNNKKKAGEELFKLVKELKAKFVVVSYNNEGFISREEMETELAKFGKVEVREFEYNAFRGSRNLGARESKIREFLFVVER